MKMNIMGFDMEVKFDNDMPAILCIEDTDLYASIVYKLYNLSNGLVDDNEILFIESDEILNFSKEIGVCFDVFGYDLNNKKYLNKLYLD